MGDRMFASEGDSVNVGRQVSPAWEDRWGGRPPGGGGGDDGTAAIVRRLQGRVDRHRWLLDRIQADPLAPEPAGLPELLDTAARMRRDTESLLLLHGQDPGVRSGGVRHLSDVLADAVATAEEPRRVDVRPAPDATLTSGAATELMHVLAELVDHVTAVYPGARVEVSSLVEDRAGIAVEVRVGGATRHDPDGLGGRRALGAAERLAQRSLSGIVLRAPQPGVAAGPVASIHCPGSVVTLAVSTVPAATRTASPEPDWAVASWERTPPRPAPARSDPPGVDDPYTPAFVPSALDLPMADLPALGMPMPEPPALDRYPLDRSFPDRPGRDPFRTEPAAAPYEPEQPLPRRTNGNGPRGDVHVHFGAIAGSPVDELFGPMLDLAHDPADEAIATPIFEAIASAWFREDEPAADVGAHRNGGAGNGSSHNDGQFGSGQYGNGNRGGGNPGNGHGSSAHDRAHDGAHEGTHSSSRHGGGAHSGDRANGAHPDTAGPRNWETPSDGEWRAAAERAARPEPESETAGGLPRRRPGNQLVPPPRGGAGVPEPERAERVPDRVRERLSTYQRGLRQGRHRAEPNRADPGDPAAW